MQNKEARFKEMIEESPDLFWEFDQDANFTYVSPRVKDLLGYEPEELVGKNAFDLMDPEEANRVRQHFDPISKKFKPFKHLININRHKDGHEVVIESSGTPLFDKNGDFYGYRGIDRDITNRTKIETELFNRKKLFRDFFESNPIATIMTSLSGEIKMINPAFSRISGYTFEELAGKTTLGLGLWKTSQDRDLALKKIIKHKTLDNLEMIYRGRDGTQERVWKLSSRLIHYEGEDLILSIILDITDQRDIEQGLRELDQAKNDFIKIAAHELNTPLLAILGFAELLDHSGTVNPKEQQEYISMIISNAETLRDLIRLLLDAEKIQLNQKLDLVFGKVSLNSFLKQSIRAISAEYPEHKFILKHVNELPEYLYFDELRMTQVFNNLLSNAAKFSPPGKAIEITTQTIKDDFIVSVIDHGKGMADEDVEKIFDKFYRSNTNSSVVGGLGLGMYIVKNIMDAHRGNISVRSKKGHGTTVTLSIPCDLLKRP